jgi:hypothetical protein
LVGSHCPAGIYFSSVGYQKVGEGKNFDRNFDVFLVVCGFGVMSSLWVCDVSKVNSYVVSIYRVFTQFVNLYVKTLTLLGDILPENDCAFEFDDHLVDCQML